MRRGPTRLGRGTLLVGALVVGAAWAALLPARAAFADDPPTPPAPVDAPVVPPIPAAGPEAPPPPPEAPAAPAAGTATPPTPVVPAEPAAPATPAAPDVKPADAPPVVAPIPAPAAVQPPPPPLTRAETHAVLAAPTPWPAYAPCEPCPRARRWAVRIEGGVSALSDLEKNIGEGVPVGTDELSWDRLRYDPTLSGRLGLELDLNSCNSLEAGFAWYGSFTADGTRANGAFGFSPPVGSFSPPLSVTLNADAEVYGARAAWWHTVASNGEFFTAQLGVGARWVHFHETSDATDWQPVTGPAPSLHGEATNDLLAALAGARIALHPTACWTFSAEAEVFGGWMHRAIDVRDTAVLSAGSHSSSIENDDFSWGFELEFSAMRTLTDRVALRGSIGMLYLADVNRADTVFDLGQAATGVVQARDDGSDAIIPYAYLGLEFSF